MNKKLVVVSLLAVFMLVAISLVSAVSTQHPVKPVERKDSPLFGIRTRRAIGDRLKELRENIKARFIGERLFFLPFQWLRNREKLPVRFRLMQKPTQQSTCVGSHTCTTSDCSPTCGVSCATYTCPTCETCINTHICCW